MLLQTDTKANSWLEEKRLKQAYIELEENIMELDDEEFWEELQSKYDFTKIEDIKKAQEETKQRLI